MGLGVLRYAVANAFATCRQLGLCKETTSMWEWQWQVLRRRYFAHPLATRSARAGGDTTPACVPLLQEGKDWL